MPLPGGGICGQPASDVDHIIELQDGGSFHDLANLRSLCYECHKAKTAACRKIRAMKKKIEKLEKASIKAMETSEHDQLQQN